MPPESFQSDPARLERLAYRVKEAADALAISRSRFYELVAAGEIRVLKDGARTLVRRCELDAFLERLELKASAAEAKQRQRRQLAEAGPRPRATGSGRSPRR